MGIQTMASHGGGQRSQIQSLGRQGSLYNLTLNEVQTHLGEPLHSMNLDELLKGLDADQSFAVDGPAAGPDPHASGSGIDRQGSVTMPRYLTKKTVEEVWRDISNGIHRGEGRRSSTMGETTLEDFLVKAGVIPDAPRAHFTYPQVPAMALQAMRGGGGSGRMLEGTYPEGQTSPSPPTVGAMSDPQTAGRKRGHSGDATEKMVERRQKRMIKNRESAARSRARKQAYTNELENKVSRLEEENERLKKQKELDKILFVPPPEPKYQLRRTSSASF